MSPLGEENAQLPDFIIGGAMKSGTSSLHVILDQHPDIYIPASEVHFFCIDDIVQHPEFFDSAIGFPDFERDLDENLEWYASFFEAADRDQLIGEDSTVYLASPKAPKRIKDLLPDVKLLFMLRHPVNRTYSHYWHRVRMGRAVYRFEDELRFGSSALHQRSFYARQLQRYFDLFPRGQIKVILFERFVQETQKVVDEVCSFLGLTTTVDLATANPHANASRVPRLHWLQLILNYVSQGLWDRYSNHLPGSPETPGAPLQSTRILRSLAYRLRHWNLQKSSYPPMNEETCEQLAAIYARENQGLQDILEIDLREYWPFIEEVDRVIH
jgi:hypothetical protein